MKETKTKAKPKQTPVLGLALSVLWSVLLGSPSHAQSTIEQVVLSTDDIPGGGSKFGDLSAPSINGNGAIAFNDFGHGIFTNADGSAIGSLRMVVGRGDVPPGILGPLGGVAEPSLNDDGSFAFRGFGIESSRRGIYLSLPSGGLRLVADASTHRPGTDEFFVDQSATAYGPGTPVAGGARLRRAPVTGTGPVDENGDDKQKPDQDERPTLKRRVHVLFSHGTVSTRGVYEAVFDNVTNTISLLELVALGSDFIESPGFSSPLDYAINENGVVAVTLRRPDFTRGIYSAGPDRAFGLIVQTGDPVPGGGTFSSGLGVGSINAAGDIVFTGIFDSNVGIFVADAQGGMTRVIDTGAEVPNHPGVKFSSFGDVRISDDGPIIFRGRYTVGEGRDAVTFDGIYRSSDTGLDVVFDQFDGIVVDGELVSLVVNDFFGKRVLDLFLAPRFANNSSDVGFLQLLPDAGPPGRSGIFAAHSVSSPASRR